MKIKICERCHKKIRPKVEDYFQIDSYEKGKLVKVGFLHKRCNVEMEKQKEALAKTFDTLGKMTLQLNEMLGLEKQPTLYEIQ